MNLLAQPVRGGAQNQQERPPTAGKATDKTSLRGFVERMVDEKLAGQPKQTPARLVRCVDRAKVQSVS